VNHPENDEPPLCDWQEAIALYLLGALPDAEATELEQHLETGCAACAAERDAASATIAEMDRAEIATALAVELPEPSPTLRARLLASLPGAPNESRGAGAAKRAPDRVWQRWSKAPAASLAEGLATIGSDEGAWETTAFPGVRVKPLFVDAARRYVTMLIRMDAKSSYPGHRHADNEECYVISGDLEVSGRRLSAGDYQLAEKGSVHGVQSTVEGCLLLIVSSQDDEMM
jgi:anti-sigma factor ChrR (cupin superfamily)